MPGASATPGDEAAQVWEALVPRVVHPVKVAVIEALRWIGRPMSPTELVVVLDCKDFYLGLVAYHVGKLVELGAVEPVRERQVRGAIETFYFFPGPD